jgi:hypothetical protein
MHSTVCRFAWILYGSTANNILEIQKDIDNIFFAKLDYSVYPENDWDLFGYKPPEGYKLLGAWRHPETILFAFLLDSPHIQTIDPAIQLILYVAGETSEFNILKPHIESIKTKYEIDEKRHKIDTFLEERINLVKSRSPSGLLVFLGVMASIINIFSLYLRKIPQPTICNYILEYIYNILIAFVHIGSILLILL